MTNKPIDLMWVIKQIDALIDIAKKMDLDSPLRAAVELRAEHYLDLYEAWMKANK